MKLHFGFESVPYSTAITLKRKGPVHRAYGQGKTSLQVAKELDQKYKVLEAFYDMEADYMIPMIENALIEDLEETVMMSRGTRKQRISDAITDKIAARFRRNIAIRKYDGVIRGVPTLASLRGVSHLRQHPYAPRESRPSFRDTGNYVNSFRAWTED